MGTWDRWEVEEPMWPDYQHMGEPASSWPVPLSSTCQPIVVASESIPGDSGGDATVRRCLRESLTAKLDPNSVAESMDWPIPDDGPCWPGVDR
jgi:hypothetical protein